MNRQHRLSFATAFLALAVFGCATFTTRAAEVKIATVDLKKVFDNYYKTKMANSQLDEQKADIMKKRDSMLDDYKKANEEYKKMEESASDQAASSDEREKRKSAAEKKLQQIKEIEQSANLFQRNSDENLQIQVRRMTENIVGEIRNLIEARARAGGYTLVLDVAAESGRVTPTVLYTNGENDLTEDVLSTLNAAAPANMLKSENAKEKPDKKKSESSPDNK